MAALRMDRLAMAVHAGCRETCNGKWLRHALEILEQNCINIKEFSDALLKALNFGRGKGNNIFLIGPKDCGKSFLLEPLEDLFECFINPTRGKYAWLSLEGKEVILLNDFRYSADLLEWNDLLLLLQGAPVSFSRPRNVFASDFLLGMDVDLPIFATGQKRIVHEDRRETEMMNCRWHYFVFTQLRTDDGTQPCTCCFAKLLLSSTGA